MARRERLRVSDWERFWTDAPLNLVSDTLTRFDMKILSLYACVIFTILGEIQESMKKIREIGILVSDVSEALKNKETI